VPGSVCLLGMARDQDLGASAWPWSVLVKLKTPAMLALNAKDELCFLEILNAKFAV
jgi:hypothetical protein